MVLWPALGRLERGRAGNMLMISGFGLGFRVSKPAIIRPWAGVFETSTQFGRELANGVVKVFKKIQKKC
jgi:hypothetical protein